MADETPNMTSIDSPTTAQRLLLTINKWLLDQDDDASALTVDRVLITKTDNGEVRIRVSDITLAELIYLDDIGSMTSTSLLAAIADKANAATITGDWIFNNNITGNLTGNANTVTNGVYTNVGNVFTAENNQFDENILTGKDNGAVGTGLTCVENGIGKIHITVLTLTDVAIGSPVDITTALAFGKLIYTLPAGAQLVKNIYIDIALTGTATIVDDTPDVGIGSVIASGAVSVLGGTSEFEDYLEGQTSGAISGANSINVNMRMADGVLSDIPLSLTAGSKAIHLNVADTWAGAGDVTVTGTIEIEWLMFD